LIIDEPYPSPLVVLAGPEKGWEENEESQVNFRKGCISLNFDAKFFIANAETL
jgi:16S rRNA U1498 N3-methylase RsmE